MESTTPETLELNRVSSLEVRFASVIKDSRRLESSSLFLLAAGCEAGGRGAKPALEC
jgi:hypothetical protein